MKQKLLTNQGFTLIEIVISLALFSLVAVIAVGALLKVVDSDKKAQSIKAVVNNLNFALESMGREARTGVMYYCSTSGDLANRSIVNGQSIIDPQDCTNGNLFEFKAAGGQLIAYRINNGTLEKAEGTSPAANINNGSFEPVISSDVKLTSATFTVKGSAFGDTTPGRVFLVLKGYVSTKQKLRSDFIIQTSISQRSRE